MPPLRSEEDRAALIAGVIDGTIDCITSNHVPREAETKHLEFPYADFGAINLATSFAAAATVLREQIDETQLIDLFTTHPAAIIQQDLPSIAGGNIANLTIYQYNKEWTPDRKNNRSKSINSPLWGTTLQGRPVGVINNGQLFLRENH